MRKAKIHLGLPKTGTTSLQNVLTNNSGKYSYQGKFSDESYTSLYNFIFYGNDLRLVENSLPINILLSNEDILFELMYAEKAESSGLFKKIYSIIERSESIGYITEFYVFYRPIRTYIKSFYAQVYIPYLVNGKYDNFEKFLNGFFVQNHSLEHEGYPSLGLILDYQRLQGVFDNLGVRLNIHLLKPEEDIIKTFSTQLDLALDIGERINERRENGNYLVGYGLVYDTLLILNRRFRLNIPSVLKDCLKVFKRKKGKRSVELEITDGFNELLKELKK